VGRSSRCWAKMGKEKGFWPPGGAPFVAGEEGESATMPQARANRHRWRGVAAPTASAGWLSIPMPTCPCAADVWRPGLFKPSGLVCSTRSGPIH
jgi:hypothetical protein